jgi:DNA-binding response OmpR family regulator
MRGDEAKAMETGCDGYLTKPIDTRAFLATVADFLRGKDTVKEATAEVHGEVRGNASERE